MNETERQNRLLFESIRMTFELMASDEFIDPIVTFTWNLFVKLKEKGFTEDQAIMLVTQLAKSSK